MRNLKKFLALVLAFMMAMSLMVTANAAVTENKEFSDSNTVEKLFEEDLLVVNGMGIIQGFEDGTFGPQRNVTRGQMAAIVYRLATGDASDARNNIYSKYNKFNDVKDSDWFAGYIGYCADAGYIVGYPDGDFKPYAEVTGYQALTMILRAMGYKEPGHNFEGSTWKAETSSTATQRGMLININNTNYRDTLNLPATRELVAEMAFQGATKEMVQWTNAYGYQTTGMQTGTPGQGAKNPTLGYLYYGLTSNDGVIVGNQATGEKVTKIGFDLDSRIAGTNLSVTIGAQGDIVGVNSANQTAFTTSISDKVGGDSAAYITASSKAVLPTNVTRTFKWESGLDMFGHAVTVWYDNRSNSTVTVGAGKNSTGEAEFTTNLNTYAVFDRVVSTAVVPGVTGVGALNLTNVGGTNMADVADDYDFVVDSTNGTYWNYSFGPTGARNVDGTDANPDIISPIMENNNTDAYPLYLLISNSASNRLDMVVSLDMTITQITQQNNVLAPLTVGVYNKNGASGTAYFDVADTATVGANTTYANIAQKNLVSTSIGKELGDLGKKVAAIEITGTTGANLGKNNNLGDSGNAIAAAGMNSTYYYELTELKHVVPGTVVKIDTNDQTVYLSDGSKLEKSVFADAVDGTFKANMYVNAPVAYSTYNFTLDEDGNYIYWEPIANTTKFVYGTYLDYTTQLNSSVYAYSMVGVDTNGKQTIDTVKNYTVAKNYTYTANGNTYNFTKPSGYSPVTAGTRYPFANAANYNGNLVPKRDMTNQSGYVANGQYVGYTIDEDGQLIAVTDQAGLYGGTAAQPYIQGNTTYFGAAAVSIGSRDVSVGAKEVVATTLGTGVPGLYLTNNTQFYIVSGAGTDTQKVTPYKGLAELMDGMDSVIIHGEKTVAATATAKGAAASSYWPLLGTANNYEMIYYTQSPFTYAQDYVNSAYQVDTVFIPAEAIEFNPSVSSNLVFVGNSASTLINAIGAPATQFTMYKDGVGASYWISGLADAGSCQNSADTILDLGDNVFYKLVDTGLKAMDGQPIYSILAVVDATAAGSAANAAKAASNSIIGRFYDGTTTVNVSDNITTAAPALYKATTHDSQVAFIGDSADYTAQTVKLFNVGGSVVKNLNTRQYPGIVDTLATLNQASSLSTNNGVAVSCVLSNSATVSVTYVNYVAPTP